MDWVLGLFSSHRRTFSRKLYVYSISRDSWCFVDSVVLAMTFTIYQYFWLHCLIPNGVKLMPGSPRSTGGG
jgi:hypothetical protein